MEHLIASARIALEGGKEADRQDVVKELRTALAPELEAEADDESDDEDAPAVCEGCGNDIEPSDDGVAETGTGSLCEPCHQLTSGNMFVG